MGHEMLLILIILCSGFINPYLISEGFYPFQLACSSVAETQGMLHGMVWNVILQSLEYIISVEYSTRLYYSLEIIAATNILPVIFYTPLTAGDTRGAFPGKDS